MRLLSNSWFRKSWRLFTTGLFWVALSAAAQTSGLLRLQPIHVPLTNGPVQLMFGDYGTGSTNYVVEFTPGLETNNWQVASNAIITPQEDGVYSVQISTLMEAKGFYRVSGLGGTNDGLVVTFTTAAFQASEGDAVTTMLVFSQPFAGWIYYTVSGTAGAGDYQVLSGSNYVNGTTTTIPVSLADNDEVGQLKYLTLRLEAGPGYALGQAPSTTITIGENDADWRGTFVADNTTLGFTLRINESNGLYQATLQGDGSGFFPAGEVPAAIGLTESSFSANASGIALGAGATLLNSPASLSLLLSAMNGLTNQFVSETQIQGTGQLTVQYTGQPQLNTTSPGTFLLVRPPVAPSTNQVQLVTTP